MVLGPTQIPSPGQGVTPPPPPPLSKALAVGRLQYNAALPGAVGTGSPTELCRTAGSSGPGVHCRGPHGSPSTSSAPTPTIQTTALDPGGLQKAQSA